jgi:hypothetical protein
MSFNGARESQSILTRSRKMLLIRLWANLLKYLLSHTKAAALLWPKIAQQDLWTELLVVSPVLPSKAGKRPVNLARSHFPRKDSLHAPSLMNGNSMKSSVSVLSHPFARETTVNNRDDNKRRMNTSRLLGKSCNGRIRGARFLFKSRTSSRLSVVSSSIA